LLSPHLLLDGDECVLGLMARHVAQGNEFPIFLYGQHYGLSTVEAAAGALAFFGFGAGAVPLKLAMLAVWTTGIAFLFLALSRLLGAGRSFWITLVLVLTPAWANASMNAWGGYVTSFTATASLSWLLLRDRERQTAGRWLIAGVLTAVIYLAQPLWLPGVLPIVMLILVARRRLSWGVGYLVVAASVILLVKFAAATTVETWRGPVLGNPDPFGSLPHLARQIYVNLTGSYYLRSARSSRPGHKRAGACLVRHDPRRRADAVLSPSHPAVLSCVARPFCLGLFDDRRRVAAVLGERRPVSAAAQRTPRAADRHRAR
jgi:hypothetical protein